MLPKLLYEKRKEAADLKTAADKSYEELAAARQTLRTFGPVDSSAKEEELAGAKAALRHAETDVTNATKAWMKANDALHDLQVEGGRQGALPASERPEEAGPLGPKSLPRHTIGDSSTLELLRKSEPLVKVAPRTELPILFDGNTRVGGLAPVQIGSFLMATRAEAQREAERRRLQAEEIAREERERKAREAEARRIAAAQKAEAERQRAAAAEPSTRSKPAKPDIVGRWGGKGTPFVFDANGRVSHGVDTGQWSQAGGNRVVATFKLAYSTCTYEFTIQGGQAQVDWQCAGRGLSDQGSFQLQKQ